MNATRKPISRSDLLGVFRRSLLIQAAWSYDRMQTLGFAYALEPVLRKIYPDEAEYESRLGLHLEYFNTQPYCAAFILGAVVRIEEERALGVNAARDVSALKTALMAPLGALGDSFFWAALKPMVSVIAAALLVTGIWWAPLLFLALYNAWHGGFRLGMFFWGYRSAGDAVAFVSHYRLTNLAKRFKVISLTMAGGMLGMMPFWQTDFKPAVDAPGTVVTLGGVATTLVLVTIARRGGSPVKIMLGLAMLCLALAFAGVGG